MPENASRAGALYDQFEDEQPVADWGGDELFTRMPRPRAVDNAPPPRFRPQLVAPEPAAAGPAAERGLTLVEATDPDSLSEPSGQHDRDPASRPPSEPRAGERAMLERAQRLGISLVDSGDRWELDPDYERDETTGRRTKVITGHPEGAPRPLPTARADRRERAARTTVEWIGPRPERLVGWAFALGMILILIAILTA